MRRKIYAIVTLVICEGVAEADIKQGLMGVGNRLRRPCGARCEHKLGHIVIIRFKAGQLSIPFFHDLFIRFHAGQHGVAKTDKVLAVIHLFHDRLNPLVEGFTKEKYLAFCHVRRIFDIAACKTEIQRSHRCPCLQNTDVTCVPLHAVHHQMYNNIPLFHSAFLYQIIGKFVCLVVKLFPGKRPPYPFGRKTLDNKFSLGKLACIEPGKYSEIHNTLLIFCIRFLCCFCDIQHDKLSRRICQH